mmetsp:Transcript_35597/g.100749  ORF Transcript_35597/g.100749 Transcript_35597/m.100749 type:complete len:1014 (-) Transcript_35597:492-3533(-)
MDFSEQPFRHHLGAALGGPPFQLMSSLPMSDLEDSFAPGGSDRHAGYEYGNSSHLAGILPTDGDLLGSSSSAPSVSTQREFSFPDRMAPEAQQSMPVPGAHASASSLFNGLLPEGDVSSLAAMLDRQLMLSASAPVSSTSMMSSTLPQGSMGLLSAALQSTGSAGNLQGVAEDEECSYLDDLEYGNEGSNGSAQQLLETWQSLISSGALLSSGAASMGSSNGPNLPLPAQLLGGGGASSAMQSMGEHPFGEHPSRTLFVRNINWSVEESEIRSIFEPYGEIRAVYTACKHRGFVMVSYYDLRSAKAAMRALQGRVVRRRRLDIHFSIPKDNPNDKDVNQGTLVVFNLDSSVTNEELYRIFSQCGELKEIRETPKKKNHKFIEYYDIRAAANAMQLLNHAEVYGKRIKLEPSRPGGTRRTVMQQQRAATDDEKRSLLHTAHQPWNIPQPPNRGGGGTLHATGSAPGDLPSYSAPSVSQLLQMAGNPYGIDTESPNTSLHGPYSSSGSSYGSLTMSFQQQQQQAAAAAAAAAATSAVQASLNGPSPGGSMHRVGSASALPSSTMGLLSHSLQENMSGLGASQPQQTDPWSYESFQPPGLGDLQEQALGGGNGQQDTANPPGHPININGVSTSHVPAHSQLFGPNSAPAAGLSAAVWGPPEASTSPGNLQFAQGLPLSPTSSPWGGGLLNAAAAEPPLQPGASRNVYGTGRRSDTGATNLQELAWQQQQRQAQGLAPSLSAGDLLALNGLTQLNLDSQLALRKALASNAGLTQLLKQLAQNSSMPFEGRDNAYGGAPDRFDRGNPRGAGRRTNGSADPVADAQRKAQQERMFSLDLGKVASGDDQRTTLMIKNIPNKYTQKMLLSTIDEFLSRSYDFFYLPIDFKNKCNMGYAFINMVAPRYILPLVERLNNRKWEKFNSEKVASISYARIQGKVALVNHFQNSSLMHEDKHCRPIIFASDGVVAGLQEPFPVGPNVRARTARVSGKDSRKGSMVNLQAHGEESSTPADAPLCGSI